MAIAWSGRKHLPSRDASASYETRAAGDPCNQLTALRASVEKRARDACEGLADSADVNFTQTFSGCPVNKLINERTVTVVSATVRCGDLRSSSKGDEAGKSELSEFET